MSETPSTWVSVGRIGRPHGVKGGIRVWLHNEESDLLSAGIRLRLLPAEMNEEDAEGPSALELSVKEVYGENLVTFDGYYGREKVAPLTGRALFALREEFPELDENESYLVDLIGAEVRSSSSNELYGVIESFGDNGAQPLARVRKDRRTVEMPFAPGLVVDVSDDSKLVLVDVPEGLFDGEAYEAKPPSAATKSERERARAKRRKKELKRVAAKAAKAEMDGAATVESENSSTEMVNDDEKSSKTPLANSPKDEESA
ncbi:MAG: 16S rRNA processing protein RimM [Deltaproteobacteria bacterium]|nr:16S rRNA processing protein RimM [Deltaproteobacteria bacterium]